MLTRKLLLFLLLLFFLDKQPGYKAIHKSSHCPSLIGYCMGQKLQVLATCSCYDAPLTNIYIWFPQVRWADLEEAKEEQRKREIGFCIGTSWSKVSEEEAEHILLGGKPERKATDL